MGRNPVFTATPIVNLFRLTCSPSSSICGVAFHRFLPTASRSIRLNRSDAERLLMLFALAGCQSLRASIRLRLSARDLDGGSGLAHLSPHLPAFARSEPVTFSYMEYIIPTILSPYFPSERLSQSQPLVLSRKHVANADGTLLAMGKRE